MLVTCCGWLEVGDSSTCTMGVGLVTSTRLNSYEGCIKFTSHCIPGFCSKRIPWRIGIFWNWQPDKCIILHHHLYILLKNKERTLNFTFRSGLWRLCRLLDNGNFDVIFDACVCARCWITPLWVRPELRACLEVSFVVKNSVMYTYLLVLMCGSWRVKKQRVNVRRKRLWSWLILTVRGKTHAHHNKAEMALLFDAQQLAKA